MFIPKPSRRSELVPAFVRLLRDNEAEVRVAAAGKLSAFCKILAGEAVISALLPCVKELSTDSSQFVRTALASVVMELAPLLGKAATIEHLLPVFLALLKDDYPDVRLNIISKLEQVGKAQGLGSRLSPFHLNLALSRLSRSCVCVEAQERPHCCALVVKGRCSAGIAHLLWQANNCAVAYPLHFCLQRR